MPSGSTSTRRPEANRRAADPPSFSSPAAYNGRVGLALFCPVTSRVKGYPFEVAVPDGLGVAGVILADQVQSLDWRKRNATVIGTLPGDTVAAVLRRGRPAVRDDRSGLRRATGPCAGPGCRAAQHGCSVAFCGAS